MLNYSRFRVLFVCIGNACRSPMAEAVARQLASDVIEPSSAGLCPLGRLAENTERVLRANGYPSYHLESKPLRRDAMERADIIINMSGEALDCLLENGTAEDSRLAQKIEHWSIDDPFGGAPTTYQRTLEELESRILLLANRLRRESQAKHQSPDWQEKAWK
jgi:arsenate reductase (thioredoxin)